MIDLELYKFFYEVASIGNITKASEKLNISQPALSKRIQNLEDALNTTLFYRTPRGLILNNEGKYLFLNIKNEIMQLIQIENHFIKNSNSSKGVINIGANTTLIKKLLLNTINNFANNEKMINVNTDPTIKQLEMLKNGSLDLIVAKKPLNLNSEFFCKEIYLDSNIFVSSKNLSNINSVKNLTNYQLLVQSEPSNSRNIFNKLCLDYNLNFDKIMNISSANLLIELSKTNIGIGFVSKLYANDLLKNHELYELKLLEDIPNNSICIITLKNNIKSSIVNDFITLLLKDLNIN